MKTNTKASAKKARPRAQLAEMRKLASAGNQLITASFIEQDPRIYFNNFYEELECIGYNPEISRLEAVVNIKQSTGYLSDLCGDGSKEYVRFFVDFDDGAGWQDVGVASFRVYNIPDTEPGPQHPISYTAYLTLDDEDKRRSCLEPLIVKVRAILAWNEIPGDDPNQGNILFGDRKDAYIQIKKRTSILSDFFFPIEGLSHLIPSPVLQTPQPEIGQLKVDWETTLPKYQEANIPNIRSSFGTAFPLISGFPDKYPLPASFDPKLFNILGLDLSAISDALQLEEANTDYESLLCVGMNTHTDTLSAIIHIKRPSGYSGDLCRQGSTEYVAFWADWDNNARFDQYLGTAGIQVYDMANIPEEGIYYSIQFRISEKVIKRLKTCEDPEIVRIRAVLSWEDPPSETNPTSLETWGNRIDSLVQLRKQDKIQTGDLVGRFTKVGDVLTSAISNSSGLAFPGTNSHGNNRPFGQKVRISGEIFNLGTSGDVYYRIRVISPSGEIKTIDSPQTFDIINKDPSLNREEVHEAVNGWFKYLEKDKDVEIVADRKLVEWDTTGLNGKYEIQFFVTDDPTFGTFIGAESQHVMLDNKDFKHEPVSSNSELDLSKDLDIIVEGGECRIYKQGEKVKGQLRVIDDHFRNWSLDLQPRSKILPPGSSDIPVSPLSQTVSTPGAEMGAEDLVWEVDTTRLAQCGYTLTLRGYDRAILNNNQSSRHSAAKSVGFTVLEKKST